MPLTPEQPITKAEFKRILQPGMHLLLTDCLIGPVAPDKQARTVVKPTSYGFVMARPDGRTSDLRFEAGEHITRAGRTLTIYTKTREIAARYVIQETTDPARPLDLTADVPDYLRPLLRNTNLDGDGDSL